MAYSAADMVALIDQAIADRITGGAAQSVSAGGTSLSNYSLTELRNLRREYAALALTATNGTGLQKTLVTNDATSA